MMKSKFIQTRTGWLRPGTKEFWRRFRRGGLRGLVAAGVLLAAAWFLFPFPMEEVAFYPSSTVLVDRTGAPLRVTLGPGDVDCRPVRELSNAAWLARAMVAAEDRRFWQHPGVDPLSILRAAWQNLTHLRRCSGASTLTTQLVRQVEPRPRTWCTKVIESFRALQLERRLDKTEILEQYLNRVPFGSNLIGAGAASRRYFGKDPGQLSLAEAALLAGLPQSPSRLRPDRHFARAKARQQYVLDRMRACGMITAAQCAAAWTEPLAVRAGGDPFRAPHFTDLVLQQTAGKDKTHELIFRTTLDPRLQAMLEAQVTGRRPEWRADGITGGAAVILDVRTGAVRALVGSPDYWDRERRGRVNGAMAPRSPGSALKPFAYALAMDQGRLTPGTVLADVPRRFRDYQPENFDGGYCGLVSARDALVLSLNLPALAVVEEVGQPVFYQTLRRLGLGTLDRPAEQYGLGLAVGGCEVRLLDLANAYACLARGGIWNRLRLNENENSEEAAREAVRVFSPEACWLVADMLGGDERALAATGQRVETRAPRFAWKTGTSAGFRDAWTVAWNPDYVVGVWLGNPDGHPAAALVGTKTAAPFVWDLIYDLYRGRDAPWFVRPAGVARRMVCAVSGLPPGPYCPQTVEEDCLAGVSRPQPCAVHRRVAATGDAAAAVREVWPPEVMAFLARTGCASSLVANNKVLQRVESAAGGGPRILSPARGQIFRVMENLSGVPQRLSLRGAAVDGDGDGRLHWLMDDLPVGNTTPAETLSWPLARGRHILVCVDDRGRADRVEIRVE